MPRNALHHNKINYIIMWLYLPMYLCSCYLDPVHVHPDICRRNYLVYFLHIALPQIFKPIFHCDARPLKLGPYIGLNSQRTDFALPIPTCWYLKTPTPTLKLVLPPMQIPNASQWNISCVFFSISFNFIKSSFRNKPDLPDELKRIINIK